MILVHTPSGEAHIRADVAAQLGITPHARISQQQYDAAVWADYQANREDRRKRA
jgi:hypothetical protein